MPWKWMNHGRKSREFMRAMIILHYFLLLSLQYWEQCFINHHLWAAVSSPSSPVTRFPWYTRRPRGWWWVRGFTLREKEKGWRLTVEWIMPYTHTKLYWHILQTADSLVPLHHTRLSRLMGHNQAQADVHGFCQDLVNSKRQRGDVPSHSLALPQFSTRHTLPARHHSL